MLKSVQTFPKIMAIMNATPDSFFIESRIDSNKSINYTQYKHADIVDIGFESSRPGASPLSEKDELNRLSDILQNVANFEQTLSIDTYKPNVAKLALENCFNMINDIKGGGNNGEMLEIASLFGCPIVLMHMKGNPTIMQNRPFYDDVMDELLLFFENKLELAKRIGVKDNQIILDPGIGFGKNIMDNDTIINRINDLKKLGFPILIGLSRKSFLSIDEDGAEDRLPATLGVTALAVQNGADIIRTHDVEDTYRMLSVINRILQNNNTKKEPAIYEI